MRPSVTVVIPTYDRRALLAEALASVGAQDLDEGAYDAVVVNDAGPDVTDVVDAARERGLRVQLITLASRQRVSAARNAGIEVARGQHVTFLDDDDLYLPGHLRTALTALGTDGVDGVYTSTPVLRRRYRSGDPLTADFVFDFPYSEGLLSVCDYIATASLVFREFRRTGARFDPALVGLTDWDMWLRLVREHGYRLRHVNQPTAIFHRIPGHVSMTSGTGSDPAAQARYGRLMLRLWRRWPAPDARVERFREYLVSGYWRAVGRHPNGTPPLTYYEQCLRIVDAAWRGVEPEDGIVERLAAASAPDLAWGVTG